MLRTVRSRSPLSRRALPAGVDYRLRTALRSLLAFGPTPVEMYANTSNAGLRRRVRTAPAIPFVSLDTPTDAPPAPKWASFTGGDGQFNGLVSRPQLLLPLRVLDSIIYQIDLASDSLFTANLETVSEGQTRAFNKGGFSTVNRYARVRAKFPTSDWTGWIAFGSPTAVASGSVGTVGADWDTNLANRPTELTDGRVATALDSAGDVLRNVKTDKVVADSIKNQEVLQRKLKQVSVGSFNSSPQGASSPLTATDAGSTATINIAAFTMQYGFGTVSYNSGSITSLAFSGKFYVFASDPTYAGGAVSYSASLLPHDAIDAEGLILIGVITTPPDGGGDTNGTGGGGGGDSNVF